MRKSLLRIIILCFISLSIKAQPTVEWQKTFGGVNGDDLAVIKLSAPTGVNLLEQNTDFQLFPNPTSKQITIKTNEELINSDYSVLNIMGQSVMSGKITIDNTLLNVGGFQGGTYLVQVRSKNGINVSRFIKE